MNGSSNLRKLENPTFSRSSFERSNIPTSAAQKSLSSFKMGGKKKNLRKSLESLRKVPAEPVKVSPFQILNLRPVEDASQPLFSSRRRVSQRVKEFYESNKGTVLGLIKESDKRKSQLALYPKLREEIMDGDKKMNTNKSLVFEFKLNVGK